MKNKFFKRLAAAVSGQGFYIVLTLCVAAVGVSGWLLLRGTQERGIEAAAPTPVAVSEKPAVTPAAPSLPPSPSPRPSPTPTPTPTPSPVPDVVGVAPIVESPFVWPVSGAVQNAFSIDSLVYSPTMRDWRTHSGIDLAAPVGTEVKAASGGVVDAVYKDDLLGTCVVVEHANQVKSLYANLAATPAVQVGDKVSTGAVLGAVGETAIFESSEPSHLHLEFSRAGEVVDPLDYLPKR